MKYANLAYLKEIPPFDQFKDVHVIDFLCNPIKELHIDNFSNLQRLRASRCKLEKITITNCPNLQVIDISQNRSLSFLQLDNLPKLITLDLRNTKVSSLNVSLPSLEYLDISKTLISNDLPRAPNLLALDNSGCTFENSELSPIADLYPRLQRLRSLNYSSATRPIRLDINKLSQHPSLEHIFCGYSEVICDSISPNTHITTICLQYPKFIQGTKQNLLSLFHTLIINTNSPDSEEYEMSKLPDYHRMAWEEAALLLYGPWGIPQVDFEPRVTPAFPFDTSKAYILLKGLQPSNETFSEVSEKYDISIAIDHMMGAIFGSALGDCLGVAIEFVHTNYARFALDVPLSIQWNSLPSWYNSDTFYRGTVTDDTEQAVLLMRTLADCNGEMNLAHFAHLMTDWMNHGISEHCQRCALDIGNTTRAAIMSKDFQIDPLRGSFGKTSKTGGNGCVMRTAPIGCFKFWDFNTVAKYALNFGCTTHFNDICGVCSILVSLLIAENIQRMSTKGPKRGQRMTNEEIDEVIERSIQIASDGMKQDFPVDEHREEILKYLKAESFESLDLSGNRIGYVLQATGAAVLALRKGMDYEQAMTEVVRWAGDADTNAAVVGGVIGAVVGFSNISQDLMKYLFTGNWLFVEFARMCKVMGIDPPESPFLKLDIYANANFIKPTTAQTNDNNKYSCFVS
ncbi:hypothetical protein M9Y10_034646 [Tritrichomonas musculus]|uniref:ADP-ribosylhydrolase ARH3 n=1 Tax=Tritrichomonas musculus TaxID=1915356 RepID=A0ABR2KHJ8_9EUKA